MHGDMMTNPLPHPKNGLWCWAAASTAVGSSTPTTSTVALWGGLIGRNIFPVEIRVIFNRGYSRQLYPLHETALSSASLCAPTLQGRRPHVPPLWQETGI